MPGILGFLIGILGQVWCLIVSIPDLCPLSYFDISSGLTWNSHVDRITANANRTLGFIRHNMKVLKHSPDLLNNVKIGQGQLQLIMELNLFYRIWGLQPFWPSDLNNLMNNPSNSTVISEKKMFR